MEEDREGDLTLCGGGWGERGSLALGGSAWGPAWSLASSQKAGLAESALLGRERPGQAGARSPGAGHVSAPPPSEPEAETWPRRLHPEHLSSRLRACYSSPKCKCSPEPHSLGIHPFSFHSSHCGKSAGRPTCGRRKTQRKGRGRGFGETGREDLLLLGAQTWAKGKVDELPRFQNVSWGRLPCQGPSSQPRANLRLPPASSPSFHAPLRPAWGLSQAPLHVGGLSRFQGFAKAAPAFLLPSLAPPPHGCRQGNRG